MSGDTLADAVRELIEQVAVSEPPEAVLAEAASAARQPAARLRDEGGEVDEQAL